MSRDITALTIAGFDPSGGAGVLADVRTFAEFDVRGFAAITSVTWQNENEFFGAVHQSAESVRAQVTALQRQTKIDCAKIGMLPTRELVREVARLFREIELPPPVIDPVLISSSGSRLMAEDALEVFVSKLLPLGRVVTPNIQEARILAGIEINSEDDMRHAAEIIRTIGARAVLVKGGHLEGPESIDVLDDAGTVTTFHEQRIAGAQLHGSGCVLSSAIAAGLGKGKGLEEAVAAAKKLVLEKLKGS
jgi:hydroxymethylpyrimidine kinase/phosphomethylpyrimidine kinase